MLQQFLNYIDTYHLVGQQHKILLAVSGGPDSVAMVDLFKKANFTFAIAHCNFNLRGEESDEDENFVIQLAQRYRVPLFIEQFDTKKFTQDQGVSIQMAARELRFEWFEKIRKEHHFNSIATAHHLEDGIETFFINLVRGTGIKGLRGILPQQGKIIHPLLFCDKSDLVSYLNENAIPFRTDSSNASNKYIRNRIRHHINPIFQELSPAFNQSMSNNFDRINNQYELLSCFIEEKKDEICTIDGEKVFFDTQKLLDFNMPLELLRMLLEPYGFTYNNCQDVIKSLKTSQSGKRFFSPKYQLLRDRKTLILEKASTIAKQGDSYSIFQNNFKLSEPFLLELVYTDQKLDIKTLKEANNACLDLKKLSFPLKLRKWQYGDRFIPFGMKNFKKVSDFLIDRKVPLNEKENTWVLCSGEEIVWLVGYRVDERFKVNSDTENKLVISKS